MENWGDACCKCGLAISHGLRCPALESKDPLEELKVFWKRVIKAEEETLAVCSPEITHKAIIFVFGEEMYLAIKKAVER